MEDNYHNRSRSLASSHQTERNNPFADEKATSAAPSIRQQNSFANPSNPFATPFVSRPGSSQGDGGSSINGGGGAGARTLGGEPGGQRYFHSRRVKKGEVEKPWMEKTDPKEKWVTILPIVGILVGLAISGFLVWDGLSSVVKHKYCVVFEDDFSSGFNTDNWAKEVTVGGFGNGEFEQTTAGDENVFVQDGKLFIKATPQDATLMEKDSFIDLTADGTCTATTYEGCVAATNTTAGNVTVVPPTKSGRINTRGKRGIKYGRVEVTAKLPAGDWLWPAIWMMPVNDTYGPWPASGEIDILESRGNNWTYAQGGDNIASSALHWGPGPSSDGWWRTNVKRQALHTTYAAGFNTFGLEWSQKYLFTYVNSRLLQVLYTTFDEPLWKRGDFAADSVNGSLVQDPWSYTGRDQTPFDQEFYLILNVAVGGTNGWFADGKSGKPWIDSSDSAKKDFWGAKDAWLPTWTDPQMEVSKVAMWQQCDGDEEL